LLNFVLKGCEKLAKSGQLQSISSTIEGDLGPYAAASFATIYISQTMGESKQVDRIQKSLDFMSKYLAGAQASDGSWDLDETAWAPMLGTAVSWLALRAANFAGTKVAGSPYRAGEYMIDRMPTLGDDWGGESWYHRLYGTAAGLRVLYSLGREDEEKARQGLNDIMKLVSSSNRAFGGAGGEEYLTFHLMTEMLMQEGGARWEKWFKVVRDRLIKVQNRDGSWTGHHCITSRTFSTACATLVLAAPNRYLPISQT